jgi:hypothetical protein
VASSHDSAVAAKAALAKSAHRGKMPLPQKNTQLPRKSLAAVGVTAFSRHVRIAAPIHRMK